MLYHGGTEPTQTISSLSGLCSPWWKLEIQSRIVAGMRTRSTLTVAVIGTTQTLAWASSYYLPAILADPISAGLGVSKSLFFGFFSASLLLQAALGPAIGKAIDRHSGRGVLVQSNVVLGAGLIWLALARGAAGLAGAWTLLGIGMALGLYDAAFATLTALYGREARASITGITLIAGFASTIGWPLSALLNDSFGWRGACLGWAALNLVVCLPINRFLIPLPATPLHSVASEAASPAPANGMAVLAFVFGAVGFVTGAMAAHLPRLLEMSGATATAAIAAASLMGPAQSRGAALRVRRVEAIASVGLDAARAVDASGRRSGARHARSAGDGGLRAAARRRQRAPDDIARNPSAGPVRPRRVRAAYRDHRRTGAPRDGRRAVAVRPSAERHGVGSLIDLERAEPRSSGLPCLAADPAGRSAYLSVPAIGRTAIPACSSFSRTSPAIATAAGLSPCTQTVSIATGMRLPELLMMAPSRTIACTRAAASSGSCNTAPGTLRETRLPVSS